jgi:YggT family protein
MQVVAGAGKIHQALGGIEFDFDGTGGCHVVYGSSMNPFVNLIVTLLSLYSWVLMAQIILFWLIYFKIVNPYQPVIAKIYQVLTKLTEPVLDRIRKVVPPINGVDLSAIILFVGLYFLQNLLVYYLG